MEDKNNVFNSLGAAGLLPYRRIPGTQEVFLELKYV